MTVWMGYIMGSRTTIYCTQAQVIHIHRFSSPLSAHGNFVFAIPVTSPSHRTRFRTLNQLTGMKPQWNEMAFFAPAHTSIVFARPMTFKAWEWRVSAHCLRRVSAAGECRPCLMCSARTGPRKTASRRPRFMPCPPAGGWRWAYYS